MEFASQFLADTLKRLRYYKDVGDKSFEQLTEAEMHHKPTGESNSIAIIMQHMYGNMMSRFTNFLTEDGEKEWRKRDAEFEPMALTKTDLKDFWNTGWAMVLHTIEALQPEDLHKEITIRSEKLFVLDAILRQFAHYPYHVGQIVFIAKMIKDKDWKNLSVAKGGSSAYNEKIQAKSSAVQGPSEKSEK
ncbi:MAG: DUF1572 family protein [Chitinophagaceae bacterium]